MNCTRCHKPLKPQEAAQVECRAEQLCDRCIIEIIKEQVNINYPGTPDVHLTESLSCRQKRRVGFIWPG